MANCAQCGAQVPLGERNCAVCGTPATYGSQPTYQPPQQPPMQAYQPPMQQPPPQAYQPPQAPPRPAAPSYMGAQPNAQASAQGVADGFEPEDIRAHQFIGGLAYVLFFLPLIFCPRSKFARFHANQGLLLLLAAIAALIAMQVLVFIADLFYSFEDMAGTFYWLWLVAFLIVGLVHGFGGRVRNLPIFGKIRIIK